MIQTTGAAMIQLNTTGMTFQEREKGWACGIQPSSEHCCSLLYEFGVTTMYCSFAKRPRAEGCVGYGYGHEAGVCVWCTIVGHAYYEVIGVHMSLYTVGFLQHSIWPSNRSSIKATMGLG